MNGIFLFLVFTSIVGIVLAYLGLELFYFYINKKNVKADSENTQELEELQDYKYCYKNIKEK